MRRMMLAVGMVFGLVAGCMAPEVDAIDSTQSATEFGEPDEPGTDVVKDDDHLPGGCNNPLICPGTGTGTGETGGGGGGHAPGTEYCTGCACTPTPATCTQCETGCNIERSRCEWNRQGACGELHHACIAGCGGAGLTCVCPR